MPDPGKLLIFDTHPIQYRAPIFRKLSEQGIDAKVYFFDESFDGKKWWFSEVGKIPKQSFNLPLLEGYPNRILNSRKYGMGQFYKNIKKLLQTTSPSAAIIYGWYQPEHWVIWWLCFRYNVALIFVGETFSQGTSFFRGIIKRILHPVFFSSVKHVISIGEKNFDFYLSINVPEEKITEAKYCVDTTFFELDKKAASSIRTNNREKLNIPEDAFVLLFVGRLFDRKRVEDLIKIHQVLNHHQHLHTIVVGNGPDEEKLRMLAMEEQRIHFVGFCNQAETRDMYYTADCFVVPSLFETWGLVINEAFTAGLPAVVTDTCGAADDLVLHNETGFVFRMGDIEEGASYIEKLIGDPALLARLSKNAQKRVTSFYRVEHFAKAIKTALKKVA